MIRGQVQSRVRGILDPRVVGNPKARRNHVRLIVQENGAMVEEVSCEQEAVYIGSRETCRVHLRDARIAPTQAVVFPDQDGWVLQQLDPHTAIHLNNAAVLDKSILRHGDEIRIHGFVIRAYAAEDELAMRGSGKAAVASLTKFVQYQLPPGAVVKRPEEPLAIAPQFVGRAAEASLRFSQCAAVEELMDAALRTFLEHFGAQRAWLGVRRVNYGAMEYQEGRLNTGQATDLSETGDKLKPRVLDRGQFVLLPQVSPEEPSSVMAGPLPGPDGTLGMVYVDTGELKRRYEAADFDAFILSLHLCAVQLDAIFKQVAKQRAATMDGEVSTAHAIQARLTPRKLPQWEQLQWGAFREPGREHTGDIYDVVRLANQTAAFLVAHTRAAGALPSLLMAQAQATFRAACMHLDPPHVVLRMLNHLLYDGQDDHPLDCIVGVLDPATGDLRYAAAGTTGAYIIGGRGEERRLGPGEPLPSLGTTKAPAYATLAEKLDPQETLVVYTPGVTTAQSRSGEPFSEERFLNILCDGFGQLASSLLKDLLSDLKQFTEGGRQPNDITLLLAHRV